MSRTQLDSVRATQPPTERRGARIPLVLALACAASYAVFLVLPYYLNDLDRFPLAEVAGGMHDPKDLWPFDQGVGGGLLMIGGYFSLIISPIVAVAAAAWAALDTWYGWDERDARRVVLGVLTIGVAGATFAWLVSPLGQALVAWFLD